MPDPTNQSLAAEIRRLSETDTLAKLDAAHDELSAMCDRQWHGKPAINWRIPAEQQDSDLTVAAGLDSSEWTRRDVELIMTLRDNAKRLASALWRLEKAEALLRKIDSRQRYAETGR